ncbi:hypothetical protein PR202_ga01884 [Eleusine coracana subsp. coracana]|uniref:BTB domain-containing protein n=1 Tax=Eleusine coracana subsp. coracana TaxID=191504 RepID=A0AAV5BG97_ELECO|nr:hypothetical protein PR202_ga01197 [Eleusine coracana subsp. coracana]GJM86066.1 hypothetical protein PR202_ga01884 [Eleusine coracana subsp. coracana]
MAFCTEFAGLRPSPADVRVVTSDGSAISAHSSVLAAASPVLEQMIMHARDADCTVRILGTSSGAVVAFLRFLYSHPRKTDDAAAEEEDAHGAALLALAHAYRVPWLKRRAEEAAAARLTADRAVDAAKLAALCDAPRLRMACARLAGKDLDARKERWVRERASQHVYRQLSDAMALLDRVYTQGSSCAGDGRELEEEAEASPRDDSSVRRGVDQLVRHLAACGRARNPACPRCRRAVQLLRLHAALCDRADEPCRVPLCSNLKAKMQEEGVDKTWRLLVKKVTRARVMSTLSNREVPEIVKRSWAKYSSRRTARLR